MAIFYDERSRSFYLEAKGVSYVFGVLGDGRLVHYYYGAPVGREDLSDLSELTDWFSSNSPGWDDVPSPRFSPDIAMMEYSAAGTGDFRPAAVALGNAAGNVAADLRYESHRVIAGKAMPEGLPALHIEDDGEADTLEVLLTDPVTSARVTLVYTVFRDFPVITRHVRVENGGAAPLTVERLASASVSLPSGDFDAWHLPGTYPNERTVTKEPLPRGTVTFASTRGQSSHWENPFVALASKTVTEEAGEVFAFCFVYSGSFAIDLHRDASDTVRVNVGMDPATFRWRLEPGETFTSPETVLLYTQNGLGEMTRQFHRLFTRHLLRGEWKDRKRPLLINSWEAAYFDFTGDKLVAFAHEAKKLGVEMLVMDDGWFGNRYDDGRALGDWKPNEAKLGGTMGKLASRIHAEGLKFGVWYEPEMISPDSDLYRAHPDWCLHIDGRPFCNCRRQLTLDFTRREVRDEIFRQMTEVLDNAEIDYIKWDYNRPMTEVGSAALPAERQMETAHRFLLGTYELLERLTSRYPHLLIETCSSGGGRFDAGMLYYAPQIWASDNTDPVDRVAIQMGTSFVYPSSAMGAHVSANPRTGYAYKGDVALSGTFGYELDPLKLTEEDRAVVEGQIKEYHESYDLFHRGDLYRLLPPWESEDRVAWSYVSPDRSRAVVVVATVAKPSVRKFILRLRGLDPAARYREAETGAVYTGARLMAAGVNLTSASPFKASHESFLRHYEKIN